MFKRLLTLATAAAIGYFLSRLRSRRVPVSGRPPLMLADQLPEPLSVQHTAGPTDVAPTAEKEGAFDPQTGAFGTAGTTMTDGGAARGSNIGLGSPAYEQEYREGHFRGSTPETKPYEHGGRHASSPVQSLGADDGRRTTDDGRAIDDGRAMDD